MFEQATYLLAFKALAALAILAVAIAGGIFPILATRHRKSKRFLSLGNALAGGIFLGAGFLHLLPESDEALQELFEYGLAPLLAVAGVCVLLFIDRVVFDSIRPHETAQEAGTTRPVYTHVLLIVLSIHSIIAGIALGLEGEVAASVLVMLAILFHKGSAAFALVVSVLASGVKAKQARPVLVTFSLMTPIGIALGAGATSLMEGPAATLVAGCFNALAAGTFIYVGILDVIHEEMSSFEDRIAHFTRSALMGDDDVPMPVDDEDRILKFALVVVGIASMAVLGLWV